MILARPYDRPVPILALASLVFVLAPVNATVPGVTSFRTPSGNIGCVYASGFGSAPSLRCDIRSRLRPRPQRPPGCNLDWGDSFEMARTGRARLTCHGDTAILPQARVLRYGSSWSRNGFVCASGVAGLRCRNAGGHGFFMSKQRSYRF